MESLGGRSAIISFLLLWFTSTSSAVFGFELYQSNIPNGASVMRDGQAWPGVGHEASGGGGSLNPFGVAFSANSHFWTQTLCQQDSDADGYSNGMELGDPDCVWQIGDTPSRVEMISHPGYSDSIPVPTPTKTTSLESTPTRSSSLSRSKGSASPSMSRSTTNAKSVTLLSATKQVIDAGTPQPPTSQPPNDNNNTTLRASRTRTQSATFVSRTVVSHTLKRTATLHSNNGNNNGGRTATPSLTVPSHSQLAPHKSSTASLTTSVVTLFTRFHKVTLVATELKQYTVTNSAAQTQMITALQTDLRVLFSDSALVVSTVLGVDLVKSETVASQQRHRVMSILAEVEETVELRFETKSPDSKYEGEAYVTGRYNAAAAAGALSGNSGDSQMLTVYRALHSASSTSPSLSQRIVESAENATPTPYTSNTEPPATTPTPPTVGGTPSPTIASSSTSSGCGDGCISGIVVGVVAVLVIAGIIVLWWMKQNAKKNMSSQKRAAKELGRWNGAHHEEIVSGSVAPSDHTSFHDPDAPPTAINFHGNPSTVRAAKQHSRRQQHKNAVPPNAILNDPYSGGYSVQHHHSKSYAVDVNVHHDPYVVGGGMSDDSQFEELHEYDARPKNNKKKRNQQPQRTASRSSRRSARGGPASTGAVVLDDDFEYYPDDPHHQHQYEEKGGGFGYNQYQSPLSEVTDDGGDTSLDDGFTELTSPIPTSSSSSRFRQ